MIRLRTGSLCSRSVLTHSEWAASVEGVLRMNKWAFSKHTASEVGVFRERVIRLRTGSLCSRSVITHSKWAASIEGVLRMNKWAFLEHKPLK
jgi:hypothetical protein